MIKDLVSVIIPTYNRAHLIKRSAMSVLNQTYSNLELIIVDDGSTDNTEEVVNSINDNRVIYLKQSNQGACAARNNGIDHAKGEFIAFQDSDDVWHEDKLEKQIKCRKETGADIVLCSTRSFIDGDFKVIQSPFVSVGFLPKDTLPFIMGPQMLLCETKKMVSTKFDKEMPRHQDFELFLRLFEKYTIYYDDTVLVDYYLQKDSISQDDSKSVIAWNLIIKKHPYFKTKYSKYLKFIAIWLLETSAFTKYKKVREDLKNLAFYFNNGFECKMRYLFLKLNVYWVLKNVVNKLKLVFKHNRDSNSIIK